MRLTNSRETGAFFLARATVVAILFVVTPVFLSPLYVQLFRAGGAMLMTLGTSIISFVTWLVTLVLFLALRGGFGGVPPMVAGQSRRDAVTSSAREIAAYLTAVLIVMVVVWVLNALVLAVLYASLRQSGGTIWAMPISLGASAASAILCFVIFIAVRGPANDDIPEVFA